MANGREGKLYEEIVGYISGQIEKGTYQPDDKLPTEHDLAQMFHVSRITSTRALNELQSMGLIVRRQGSGSYVANKNANGGTHLTGDFVAMIMPYVDLQGRMHEILEGVSGVLTRHNYHLTIYNSGVDAADERTLLMRARSNGIKGIILYPKVDNSNIDIIYDMHIHKFPITLVDKKYAGIPISNACVDNFKGAYDITDYLLKLGHHNIGFITNRRMEEVYSVRERYFGYYEAMKKNNVPIDFDYVVRGFTASQNDNVDIRQNADIIRRLISSGITAIVAASDVVAFEILKCCENENIKVPEDLSLVGFDNLGQCAYTTPPLTTCDQDFINVGELAVELLLQQIELNDFSFIEKRAPTSLCIRDSVRAI